MTPLTFTTMPGLKADSLRSTESVPLLSVIFAPVIWYSTPFTKMLPKAVMAPLAATVVPADELLKTGYNIALVSAESARARAQEIS